MDMCRWRIWWKDWENEGVMVVVKGLKGAWLRADAFLFDCVETTPLSVVTCCAL